MQKKVAIGLVIGSVVLIFLLMIVLLVKQTPGISAVSGESIAVIRVEGTIAGGEADGGLLGGGASSENLMEQLKQAREDDSIKAIILRINSPGGSAPASQEVGDEIDKIREEGKIVVTSMGDVAASGGYWLAAKSNRIVANPATITGSIGVIMQTQDMQELFDKIGLDTITFKSGEHKDIGSPTRPMTPEEKQILQGMVNDIFDQFVDVVAKGRKMDRAKVLEIADGRIFTGRQAKNIGLVDDLGNYYDAIKITAKMAKIKGDPNIIEMSPKNPWEELFSAGASSRWWEILFRQGPPPGLLYDERSAQIWKNTKTPGY